MQRRNTLMNRWNADAAAQQTAPPGCVALSCGNASIWNGASGTAGAIVNGQVMWYTLGAISPTMYNINVGGSRSVTGGQPYQYWPWSVWAENGERGPSWEGTMEIDPVEFGKMVDVVRSDVHDFSLGWYDTPFYNRYGTLSGTACFNEGKDCYDRSEVNYIGEGEAWAALRVSKETGHSIVRSWKWLIRCSYRTINDEMEGACNAEPSEETLYWFDVGHDDYNQHYPPP